MGNYIEQFTIFTWGNVDRDSKAINKLGNYIKHVRSFHLRNVDLPCEAIQTDPRLQVIDLIQEVDTEQKIKIARPNLARFTKNGITFQWLKQKGALGVTGLELIEELKQMKR